MNHLTMQQLEDCGFELTASHPWGDDKMVQLREKGNIQIETTWKKTGDFVCQEMYVNNIDVNFGVDELKTLDKILNHANP